MLSAAAKHDTLPTLAQKQEAALRVATKEDTSFLVLQNKEAAFSAVAKEDTPTLEAQYEEEAYLTTSIGTIKAFIGHGYGLYHHRLPVQKMNMPHHFEGCSHTDLEGVDKASAGDTTATFAADTPSTRQNRITTRIPRQRDRSVLLRAVSPQGSTALSTTSKRQTTSCSLPAHKQTNQYTIQI